MKKTIARDYAVDCFRLYETLKANENKLKISRYRHLYADYIALKKTFEILDKRKDGEFITKAVRLVYCKADTAAFKKNEISQNVMTAAKELFCSEMTIYRYLKCARDIFCDSRGLRSDEIITELFSA